MIAWSYSRLTDFEECEYRFRLKYIDRLPEEENEAAKRGTAIHANYEIYMKESDKDCPSPYFQPYLDNIKKNYPWSSETNWAFDQNWMPSEWYDKNTWLRIKPDLTYVDGTRNYDELTIIDYKTGKERRIKHTAQGQLYAIGGALLYPNAKVVTVAFWYHDHQTIFDFSISRKQIETLKNNWTQRANKLDTSDFRPKPSKWNCKYCGVKKYCEYSSKTT